MNKSDPFETFCVACLAVISGLSYFPSKTQNVCMYLLSNDHNLGEVQEHSINFPLSSGKVMESSLDSVELVENLLGEGKLVEYSVRRQWRALCSTVESQLSILH